MSEAQQLALEMEHAHQRGDKRTARALARAILADGASPHGTGRTPEATGPELVSPSPVDDARASAEDLLRRTEPDAFLLVVGVLGLGLMVWLVYNYVL